MPARSRRAPTLRAAGDAGRRSQPKRKGGRPRSTASREAILRATLTLLERHGVNELTIEGIASEAGVGKATIYRWWPSRIAVVLEALEALPELEAPDLGSFTADLRALLDNLRTLLTTTPLGKVLAHLGSEVHGREPEVREYIERRTAAGLSVVDRAIERGELPQDTDASAVLTLAVGPVLTRVFYGPAADDEFLDLVVAVVTTGVPTTLAETTTRRNGAKRKASNGRAVTRRAARR